MILMILMLLMLLMLLMPGPYSRMQSCKIQFPKSEDFDDIVHFDAFDASDAFDAFDA